MTLEIDHGRINQHHIEQARSAEVGNFVLISFYNRDDMVANRFKLPQEQAPMLRDTVNVFRLASV